jgi:ribonucleoside-diphosphate reductase alpha chain
MVQFKPNELGQQIFELRYAYPGEKTWVERAKVISDFIASAEIDDEKSKVAARFYEVIGRGDLVPGGRIIFGSGRSQYNLLNCYVVQPDDTVESIGKTINDTYKISCAGGGIGFNFSKIRPKGDHIQNIKNSAPGSISVMKMINEIGNHVKAGKNRRIAIMGILDVTHPDVLEFLHVKLDKNELINFNISVGVTNRFLEACEDNDEWYFTFGGKSYYVYQMDKLTPKLNEFGEIVKKGGENVYEEENINIVAWDEEDAVERAKEHFLTHPSDKFVNVCRYPLKAKDLFARIWGNAVESGDPGIFNIDKANQYTNTGYFETLPSSNPCGEIPLPSYGNCCLAHVNLSNMVNDQGEFDWKRFTLAIRLGVRFLDNVLTVNTFPTYECKEVGHKSRRDGLPLYAY